MKISKTQEKDEITVGELFQILREPLKMELVNSGSDLTREVGDYSINRPALALMGHFAYFANTRLQLLGAGEMAFIYEMPPSHQYEVFEILVANVKFIGPKGEFQFFPFELDRSSFETGSDLFRLPVFFRAESGFPVFPV